MCLDRRASHLISQTATHTDYATIIVKRPLLLVGQRLHTYRTNQTLPLRVSDQMSETADYTVADRLCQARARLIPVLEQYFNQIPNSDSCAREHQ